MAREPLNIGYFRSGLSGPEKTNVLKYAREMKFGNVMFVEETADPKSDWKDGKLFKIINSLKPDDRVIVPELTRLGRSSIEVLEVLKVAIKKEVSIYSLKDGFVLNKDTMHQETMVLLFDFFSELEKRFVSERTRKALNERKIAGVKLGRPPGPGKSKLDKSKNEIIALLKNGSTKAFIARKFKTTTPNLYNWLKKNSIDVKSDY
ncbi:MAG: recombinase family protein [Deltaproteobacteria bacterium]|nr:recombinase family protein [Deltaproteobacteria bacterium]